MGFGGKGLSLKAMAKIAEYSCHPILFYEYMEKNKKYFNNCYYNHKPCGIRTLSCGMFSHTRVDLSSDNNIMPISLMTIYDDYVLENKHIIPYHKELHS